MSITKAVLHFAAPLPKLETYQRFLFIGPHPDDIEIGAGATVAKLAAQGKEIQFLICCDGRYGGAYVPQLSPAELAALRRDEAGRSAHALGVQDVRFLNLKDGGFYSYESLTIGIAKAVGGFKPDVIFAPDPSVTSECHVDHLNTGNAARQIACFAPYSGIMENYGAEGAAVKALAFYMTAKPNSYIGTKGFLEKQIYALFANHLSQFPEGCAERKTIAAYLRIRAYDLGLRSLKGCAEGFRVLGVTHMHCLPEAGK